MRRRWAWRIVLPVVVVSAFAAVMMATDHDLNLWYLAAAAAAVWTVIWLLIDVVPTVPYTSWQVTALYTPRQPGGDMRLERLTDRLTSGVDRDAVAYDVHRTLSAVVDDRLRRNHGIERAADPAAAERVLGSELTTYLTTTPHMRRTGQAQEFAALLDRIEAL